MPQFQYSLHVIYGSTLIQIRRSLHWALLWTVHRVSTLVCTCCLHLHNLWEVVELWNCVLLWDWLLPCSYAFTINKNNYNISVTVIDPQEPNEKLDNATLTSMYPHSELDPELDSQNMDQLQLAPSVVILVRMKKCGQSPSDCSLDTTTVQPLVLLHTPTE